MTNTENMRRTRHVACKNGHPFDAANTYVKPDGSRVCRICRRAVRRAYVSNPPTTTVTPPDPVQP